jgi:hypothetical protein
VCVPAQMRTFDGLTSRCSSRLHNARHQHPVTIATATSRAPSAAHIVATARRSRIGSQTAWSYSNAGGVPRALIDIHKLQTQIKTNADRSWRCRSASASCPPTHTITPSHHIIAASRLTGRAQQMAGSMQATAPTLERIAPARTTTAPAPTRSYYFVIRTEAVTEIAIHFCSFRVRFLIMMVTKRKRRGSLRRRFQHLRLREQRRCRGSASSHGGGGGRGVGASA